MKTHDQLAHEAAFEQRQRDYHTVQALRDCTDAVDHADNEVTAKILADIGNRARWILTSGDLDDKISFADFVCSNMVNLINRYADAETDKDVYHRGFKDPKTPGGLGPW